MIAARPKQYCKNMSYIINARARTLAHHARPLSNSQYIFIGLIDFSRAPSVIFLKVAALPLASPSQSTFTFRFGAREIRFPTARPANGSASLADDEAGVISRARQVPSLC